MEIINKKHDDITVNRTVDLKSFIKFHNEKEIYFSIKAVKELGLQKDMFVHFVNDEDTWYFYVNMDVDGFKISAKEEGKNTMSIFNQSLITLFLRRSRCRLPCKFPLQITNAKFEGCQLIKIETNKPFE